MHLYDLRNTISQQLHVYLTYCKLYLISVVLPLLLFDELISTTDRSNLCLSEMSYLSSILGSNTHSTLLLTIGDGRVERRCWVNFQCLGVLLVWIIVGQGPIALAVGAGGGCLDIFSLICLFSFLSPSLWETARYRLKYCLKGPLNPNHQPTNY